VTGVQTCALPISDISQEERVNMREDFIYELADIEHGYGGFRLNIPSLNITRNTSVGLSGPNGSGKSTLLRLLSFLEYPERGVVRYKGRTHGRPRVTMLQQDPYLLKRTVFDNVAFGPRAANDTENLKKRAAEALDIVNLEHKKFMHRKWFELSGGEAKRVALASRIIFKPEALLLDEPVANVDSESSIAIIKAIKWMKEEHFSTIIISSHDLTWLSSITDNIWKLSDGRLAGSGTANLLNGPWAKDDEGMWHTLLPGGDKVYASTPPDPGSTAVLDPGDIIISLKKLKGISAINMLPGVILIMSSDVNSGRIRLEIEVSGRIFNAHVTEASASKMKLFPGRKIYLVFKATSFQWI
jgi:tungstate transport system ATP-binding protein